MTNPNMPDYWGPIWLVQSNKFDKDLIETVRNITGSYYAELIEKKGPDSSIDYTPVKSHMIYNASRSEHALFGKMGLSVPIEAQAAFFSVMTTGID